MGLGAIMAGIGAAVGSAVANAASSTNKKPSSSSSSSGSSGNKTSSTSTTSGSGSSSTSSTSTTGGSGSLGSQMTSKPSTVTSDADLQTSNPQAYQQIQQYKNQYNEAKALGDQAGMDKAHQMAESLRASYGYSGGLSGSGSTQLSTAQTTNNPYAGNKYISDYENLKNITTPYKDVDGNWYTKTPDMGVQFDIYDQANGLENDDLARAQYKHWRALATGTDELLSVQDKRLLGLPGDYTVTTDPRAFYDRTAVANRTGTSTGGSSSGAAGSGLASFMASMPNAAAVNTAANGLAAQMTGGYQPLGVYNDADLKTTNPAAYQQIQQYKQQYADAEARGDTAAMNEAWQGAEAIRAIYGYSGGADGSQYIPIGGGLPLLSWNNQYQEMQDSLEQAAQQRDEQYQQMMDGIDAQYEAMLGQTMTDIDAQRQEAAKQNALNNAAAEKAYMQTIKPNGSLAESLAANGLLTSGLTETSQIQAGNTYQNALNNNATTQTEALAELERLAIQAEYTNDIERLQAIQQIMQQIAENGYASAQDIAQIQQWGIENSQNNYYQQQQINIQLQQLAMQKQQLEMDVANGEIDRQTAQAQLEYLNKQIEELELTNQYNKYQLGQLGIS